jgi:hypothetical protein
MLAVGRRRKQTAVPESVLEPLLTVACPVTRKLPAGRLREARVVGLTALASVSCPVVAV